MTSPNIFGNTAVCSSRPRRGQVQFLRVLIRASRRISCSPPPPPPPPRFMRAHEGRKKGGGLRHSSPPLYSPRFRYPRGSERAPPYITALL